jgi:predicted glutamine amidotransferase
MCELFAMSSRMPATLGFSLERLARHGGAEGPHRDGWGIAFYEGPDCLLLREPRPASESPLMRFMEHQGLRTKDGLSHIRLATFGDRSLRNTQPFLRELGGRMHAFAHNGDFPALLDLPADGRRHLPPVGDTDSELAFCGAAGQLGAALARGGGRGAGAGGAARRHRRLRDRAARARPGELPLRRCRCAVRARGPAHPDGRAHPPPGLYLLQRCCWRSAPELADSGVDLETIRQDVALVASTPLTDELWVPLGEGTLIALSMGRCYDGRGVWVEPEQVAADPAEAAGR